MNELLCIETLCVLRTGHVPTAHIEDALDRLASFIAAQGKEGLVYLPIGLLLALSALAIQDLAVC